MIRFIIEFKVSATELLTSDSDSNWLDRVSSAPLLDNLFLYSYETELRQNLLNLYKIQNFTIVTKFLLQKEKSCHTKSY